MPRESVVLFCLSCIGFGFLPGPAMVQTVSLTLLHGRRAGLLSALGIHLGGLIQVAAVAVGAAALLDNSPWTYRFLKAAGGAYLMWLGFGRLRHPDPAPIASARPRQLVLSSAMIEVLNPKSALFYLAFLLQFAGPGSPLVLGWKLLLLGISANLLFSVADIVSVVSAQALRSGVMASKGPMRVGRWLAGALFIGLGAYAIVGS